MSRQTIPPGGSTKSPSKETLEVLQRRLVAAEEDTQNLVEHLSKMGFEGSHQTVDPLAVSGDLIPPITPYKPRMADSETLKQNYEVIVSRVCKMESAIQTLKLNLLRANAERDLSKKEKYVSNEKLTAATEAYEKECVKLNRELKTTKKEIEEMRDERNRAVEENRRLQEALDVMTSSKSETAMDVEEMRVSKQKLQRRVTELKDELSREVSLRASLEESHNTLLERVQNMEGIVTSEQEGVKTMNVTCSGLKRDLQRAEAERKQQEELRKQFEIELQSALQNTQIYLAKVKALDKDKEMLMQELGRMKTKYNDLNQQLDQMYKLMQQKKLDSIKGYIRGEEQVPYPLQHPQGTSSPVSYNSNQEALEKENKSLYEAMKSATSQNAEIIVKYEEQLETGRAELATRLQDGEKARSVEERLRQESRDKAQALARSGELEEQCEDLTRRLTQLEEESDATKLKLTDELAKLKDKIRNLENSKNKALKDKENLLDEVNQAVDGMTEERSQLQDELQKARLDIQGLDRGKKQIEQENAHLLERLGALEEQQGAQKQVESTMTEMLEQKNRLAYDKGRLQSKVEQLQREVEELANAQTDVVGLRKLNTALEAKLQKTQTELNANRMTVQRLESQLKHSHTSGNRKEEDFTRAIRARDEAVKEAQKLLGHIEAVEERERQKVNGLQKNLMEAREDNKKIAGTLESVMVSHSQLQKTIENLQMDLGKKDAINTQLENDRSEQRCSMKRLEKEIENLQSKLISMETIEANESLFGSTISEVEPLRMVVQRCKTENADMATSLETVVKSNHQLEGVTHTLKDQLEKKVFLIGDLQKARERDQEEHKVEVRTFEERLENLKAQLSKEREKSMKKTNKEVAEVRKQLENLLSKNGELSRANSELRHRITELEYQIKEQKEKMSSQKCHIEHLTKIRQKQEDTINNMNGISEQLRDLERTKDKYIKKNEEQSKTIKNFIHQIASLQSELKLLAKNQIETAEIIQQQDEDMTKERKISEQLKRKYKEAKKREQELEDLRRRTEDRLREANDESVMVSQNLHDAHEWFKSKFDHLQGQLVTSRKSQSELEKEKFETRELLSEEKRKAEETAEKARKMIKESRETISRLADYAEKTQSERDVQLYTLKKQLQAEKDHARSSKKKLQNFQESSFRHTEDLARELENLKSHSYLYYTDSS